MLAVPAVLLSVACLGSSFFISTIQTLEILNLALPAHLLAFVLFTLPFCRALEEKSNSKFYVNGYCRLLHGMKFHLCCVLRTCGSRIFSVTRFRFRSCLTATTRARTAL